MYKKISLIVIMLVFIYTPLSEARRYPQIIRESPQISNVKDITQKTVVKDEQILVSKKKYNDLLDSREAFSSIQEDNKNILNTLNDIYKINFYFIIFIIGLIFILLLLNSQKIIDLLKRKPKDQKTETRNEIYNITMFQNNLEEDEFIKAELIISATNSDMYNILKDKKTIKIEHFVDLVSKLKPEEESKDNNKFTEEVLTTLNKQLPNIISNINQENKFKADSYDTIIRFTQNMNITSTEEIKNIISKVTQYTTLNEKYNKLSGFINNLNKLPLFDKYINALVNEIETPQQLSNDISDILEKYKTIYNSFKEILNKYSYSSTSLLTPEIFLGRDGSSKRQIIDKIGTCISDYDDKLRDLDDKKKEIITLTENISNLNNVISSNELKVSKYDNIVRIGFNDTTIVDEIRKIKTESENYNKVIDPINSIISSVNNVYQKRINTIDTKTSNINELKESISNIISDRLKYKKSSEEYEYIKKSINSHFDKEINLTSNYQDNIIKISTSYQDNKNKFTAHEGFINDLVTTLKTYDKYRENKDDNWKNLADNLDLYKDKKYKYRGNTSYIDILKNIFIIHERLINVNNVKNSKFNEINSLLGLEQNSGDFIKQIKELLDSTKEFEKRIINFQYEISNVEKLKLFLDYCEHLINKEIFNDSLNNNTIFLIKIKSFLNEEILRLRNWLEAKDNKIEQEEAINNFKGFIGYITRLKLYFEIEGVKNYYNNPDYIKDNSYIIPLYNFTNFMFEKQLDIKLNNKFKIFQTYNNDEFIEQYQSQNYYEEIKEATPENNGSIIKDIVSLGYKIGEDDSNWKTVVLI